MRTIPFLSTVLGLAVLLPAQDSLHLKDGRFVSGPKMEFVGEEVLIHFPHGDVKIPKSIVREATLSSGPADPNMSAEDKAKIDSGQVRFENRWMPIAERDKLLERRRTEREARIKEAMSHREWANRNYLKTENFAFEFTIDPEVMRGFADLMEVYYKNFTKAWGITKPPKMGRLKVCFYHDEDYYHQVSGAPGGVIGYFRFVEPMELNFFFDRLDPDFTVDVMFHETNHYLTTLIDPKFRYPIWVNESLAEYYGASAWDPKAKKMTVGGIQEGRLAVIQDAIRADEWQGLEALIRLKHGEFNATHYAWGWSFVHWLLENKATAPKFKDFYLALGRDKTVKREPVPPMMKQVPTDEVIRLLLKHLGAKSLEELEKGWHEYVKTLKPSSGRGFYEAGRMAMMRDMPIKAQRYLKTSLDMDFKGPQVYAELGRALYLKDKDDEAIQALQQAVDLDPLNPEFYLLLSRAHRSKSSSDPEVKRLQWLALEIARATNDPNEYAILVDLGPEFTKAEEAAAPGGGK
jgi:hypothetical protein